MNAGDRRDRDRRRDRGSIMTMALVIVTALAVSVTALAGYASTSLRSARVTAAQTQRLSTLDAARVLTLEALRASSANCTTSLQIAGLAGMNGATTTIRCVPNGTPTATFSRHDVTITVTGGGGTSVGRALVQIARPGGVACTASCTVVLNSWTLD